MGLFSFFKKKDKKTQTVDENLNQENLSADEGTAQDDKAVSYDTDTSADNTGVAQSSEQKTVEDGKNLQADDSDDKEISKFTQEHAAFENVELVAQSIEEKDHDLKVSFNDELREHEHSVQHSHTDNYDDKVEIKEDESSKLAEADSAVSEAAIIEILEDEEQTQEIKETQTEDNTDTKDSADIKEIVADNDESVSDVKEPFDTDTAPEDTSSDSDEIKISSDDKQDEKGEEESVAPLAMFSGAGDKSSIAKESEDEVKESFFSRLKKTRDSLAFGISSLIKGRKIDDDLYEELETALLTADLGVDTTFEIIDRLKEESRIKELHDAELLKKNLHRTLCKILEPCAAPLDVESTENTPFVILMVGVNGAGKTTTIGKLAQKYKESGKKVMLAAGDTFRAAAVEQLKEWGKRIEVPVVAQQTGSDSASVLYDALSSARSKGVDVLICDTAGRLQNKDNLMDELKKIVRVMKKIDENVPQEVMLVLDAATGQNAVSQAKIFSEAVNVTGITLTKLDGTAKGGVIFALADKFKIPIRYVGIGEKAKDLREFSVEPFVDALLKEDK
ncbi:Cell division protein FtsY [Anaerobiospirillum thomasii]|uniref:Signal recognition particle receptor FtsY n=1 Tax=Anaerobiospirillum thomasii TaxID=179995 RepID=A0A2X0X3G2_9GAMM|nr:signal recognition particle-docking protein FtsY [Anaerobiospirillum thomasii]SPT69127.1 Cell division protein FtsY [Anaerobiospirillum thomasii]SPT72321.1 Cell division protein FtsY [Anaerobiospirillum thomasii]